MKLNEIFDVLNGSSLDLNKMTHVSYNDPTGVNFVSRSAKNQGVVAYVKQIKKKEPFHAGLISVALGGSVLSAFVQQYKFYTGEHMRVLSPKNDLTLNEKLFYCICITANKYRYSYGRQANKTLNSIELPDDIPSWVKKIELGEINNSQESVSQKDVKLVVEKWKPFRYDQVFEIKKGKRVTNSSMKEGKIPCIRPIDDNNGVYKFIDIKPNHKKNTITVNYNGSVGEAFYQPKQYFALDDINVLYSKNSDFNVYVAMFLITLIKAEKYRFSYGRKWHKERMKKSIIKLPVDDSGNPDYQFMEDYVKSLPYSSNLETKDIS